MNKKRPLQSMAIVIGPCWTNFCIWFQQDGATCHIAEATLDVLCTVFEDRINSRRADVVWPPQSYDYYLCGVFKDKCYETIDALKDNIRKAIGEIQLHTLANGGWYCILCPVQIESADNTLESIWLLFIYRATRWNLNKVAWYRLHYIIKATWSVI